MRTLAWVSAALCLLSVACGSDDESPKSQPKADAGADVSAAGAGGAAGGVATGGVAGSGASVGGGGQAGSAGAPATCSVAPKPPGASVVKITSSGQERTARLVIPPGYDATKPTALVLVFHGYLETAEQIENISQMSVAAAGQNVIVAYPQGISVSWNAGKCCGSSASQKRPDVKFVADLLDHLEQELCIDQKRIYAAGFSNGGMMSNRLACELSTRIAAIGPVAGPLAIDECLPQRPMPVIEFHGTSDIVVPYNGGGLSGTRSVSDNIDWWQKNAWCQDSAPAEVYNNGDTICTEYSQCKAGAAIRLCTVDKGGHQWPGGKSAGPAGKLTKDIDASAEMLKFFLAHPMP